MTPPKLTEAIVFGLLRDHLARPGNGGSGEFAVLAQVRNDAGFSATRSFDAVAMDLWPSRGLTLTAYEIKVSRSDWQAELRKPDKAEAAAKLCDRFVIVAPTGVVKGAELPPTWGLIEVRGDGTDEAPWRLRTAKAGEWLRSERPSIPRGFVASMLRSCPDAVPGGKARSVTARELEAARSEGYKAGHAQGIKDAEHGQPRELERLRLSLEAWTDLEKALTDAGLTWDKARPRVLAAAAEQIAAAVNGEHRVRAIDGRVRGVLDALRHAVESIEALT